MRLTHRYHIVGHSRWGWTGDQFKISGQRQFDVTLLIDLSNGIIEAESIGILHQRYSKIARQAHVIVGASAKNGIKQLVYALAG